MPATSEGGFSDRLVVLHGFTQTHHHSRSIALDVATRAGFSTITLPDLPGHGLSSADRGDFATTVANLAVRCGAGTYLGYSMGGRYALAAAIERSDLVERLVLIGATAGIEDPDARLDRHALDEARADRLEEIGVDDFLGEWLGAPMFAGLPDDPTGLDRRRQNSTAGLAHSLRTSGTGSQPSLWGRLGEVTAPVLVLAGTQDEKFSAIGRRLADALPNAEFAVVADAGHAAHTERPAATAALIDSWLGETRPG